MAKSKSATARRRSRKAASTAVDTKPTVSSSSPKPPAARLPKALRRAIVDTADAIAAVDHVRRAYDGLRDLLMWQGGGMDPHHLVLQRPELEGLLAVLNDGLGRAIADLRGVSEQALAALVASSDRPGGARS